MITTAKPAANDQTYREWRPRCGADGLTCGWIHHVPAAGPAYEHRTVPNGSVKAAIEALTRASAIELAPAGITVNAIAPGPIQTGYIPVEKELHLKGRSR